MRAFLILTAIVAIAAAPAQAGAVVFSQTIHYVGGAPGAPYPHVDATLGSAHACDEAYDPAVSHNLTWIGCAVFYLGPLAPGERDVTLTVADDRDPLVSFDWQIFPDEDCDDQGHCVPLDCAAPEGVQHAAGTVTFHTSGDCGNLYAFPGVGATTGSASVLVEA